MTQVVAVFVVVFKYVIVEISYIRFYLTNILRMKISINLALILSLTQIVFGQDSIYRPTQHFVFPIVDVNLNAGKPESTSVNRADKHEYIFNYAYNACIDNEYNLPLWVSHYLNSDLLKNEFNDRPANYPSDNQFPALKSNAYSSTGYDHGHLAPAADFKWSKYAYLQSFLMTNMSPQNGCFNQKGWCHLEGTVRKWVEENKNLELFIVSGCVVDTIVDTLCLSNDFKIYVPKYYYKVVLGMEPGKKPFCIGYLVPNEDIPTFEIKQFEKSVRSIEELTGLDFFSFLSRKVQDDIENKVGIVKYYSTKISCPDKSCESIYDNRVLPEERTKYKCD